MEQKKNTFLSKTLWTNFLVAGAAFFPVASDWMATNPTVMIVVFALVNIVLRLVTKEKLSLK